MVRVPRRRERASLLFSSLILSDLHHLRFQHRDLAQLSDDKLWAEQIELQRALARLIWTDDQDQISGSELFHASGRPISKAEWARERLERLREERSRRAATSRRGWAA